MKSYKPKQKRGYEAEKKFLDAAKQIFAEQGMESARIQDIVQLAGSSTGNFYFRFKNKEMLFYRLFEIYEREARALVSKLDDPTGSLVGVLYLVTSLDHKLLVENLGVYKAAHDLSTTDPEIWKRLQQLSRELADHILQLCEPYKQQIPFDDWEIHLRRAIQLITGYIANQAVRNAGPAHFGTQDLVDTVFRASMGILGMAPPHDFENLKAQIETIIANGTYD